MGFLTSRPRWAASAAPLAALLAGGDALAAAASPVPPLALLLHTTDAGAQRSSAAWREQLARTLADATPQPAAQLRTLRRVAPTLYAVELTCPSAQACAVAPGQLAALTGWIATVARDGAMRRPRTPTPGSPSAR